MTMRTRDAAVGSGARPLIADRRDQQALARLRSGVSMSTTQPSTSTTPSRAGAIGAATRVAVQLGDEETRRGERQPAAARR